MFLLKATSSKTNELAKTKYKVETLYHPSKQLFNETLRARDWRESAKLVKNDEMWAKIPDENENLPIHLAVKFGATNELVTLILNAYPDCIKIRDADGNLPVHLVAAHRRDRIWVNIAAIAETIVEWHPEGLEEVDANQDTPIIIAIKQRCPDEILSYLLQQDPRAAKSTDRYGNLPLHLCCQFNDVAHEFVEQLIDCHRESVAIPNKSGLLALHKACHFDAPIEMMKLIIKKYPDCIKAKDKHGNLPIHFLFLSLFSPPDSGKLNLLLKCYPNALSVTNHKGFLPLTMMNCPQDRYKDEYL